jgi:CelD/BcsL family acetyltransferase involved in cellulose biosynthesis
VIAVTYHADLKEVQADATLARLLDSPAQSAPFDRLAWWQGLAADCGIAPLLAVAREGDALAVLPLAQDSARLTALANWYTFRVRPIVSPGADGLGLLTALARDLARRAPRITLTGLPDENGEATLLVRAFRAAGWVAALAPSGTNHVLDVGGRSFADYLASRPGPLRTTLKRKAKKVEIALHTQFDAAAWAQYEAIYQDSWKPSEGSPDFLRHFAQAEGAAGRLRLAVAYAEIDGSRRAVAAQFWSVEGNVAFIHKLAHIEAAKPLSPGTALSAALFEQVIDRDRVTLVDFGTGDDGYKRDWMEYQRVRYRLTLLRPGNPANWPQIAKLGLRNLAARGNPV